jgi:hypothetical protein
VIDAAAMAGEGGDCLEGMQIHQEDPPILLADGCQLRAGAEGQAGELGISAERHAFDQLTGGGVPKVEAFWLITIKPAMGQRADPAVIRAINGTDE